MDNNESESIKTSEVQKPLELEFDIGHLVAFDTNVISEKNLKKKKTASDKYLKTIARENTQLLINEIWKLPFERVDDVVITKLPKPKYVLPREKPVPKPAPLTKWEQYSKDKGINKRNKTKAVWDDVVNKWVPRFGYRRAQIQNQKEWVLEVPKNVDPMEDQFEKKSNEKSERVSKNEFQRLRNLAKAKKVKVPNTGLTLTDRPSKTQLHQAFHAAKKATASLGKFQSKLPKERPLKKTGKKPKKAETGHTEIKSEKARNLEVLAKIMNRKPLLKV